MKAEELINRVSRRYDCPLFRLHKPEIVTKENAQYAIEMARKEEREKAIEAYRKLHCNMGNLACEFCSIVCKINMFEKLLNK